MSKVSSKSISKDLATIQEEPGSSSCSIDRPRFIRRRYKKVNQLVDENENEWNENYALKSAEENNATDAKENPLPEPPSRARSTSGSSISSSSYKVIPPIGNGQKVDT